MPKYWMITNRNVNKNSFGDDLAPMTYWSSDKWPLDNFKNWTDKSDGDAIANLTYRVTALYTGLDTVLGMSAGLKHFGKRRLGRSGLDRSYPIPDNVWDIDCTSFLKKASNVHISLEGSPIFIVGEQCERFDPHYSLAGYQGCGLWYSYVRTVFESKEERLADTALLYPWRVYNV